MKRSSSPSAVATTWVDWVRSGQWLECADTAIPMLPAMASHVVDLALDPDVSATRITNVVSKDPVLATRVIQLANSAFSAPANEITSISEAVVRMGTGPVRNVVTAACLSSLSADPRIYGKHGRSHIDHSIGTAYLAWLLADRADEPPDEAFLYGLLHDIGKLVILKLVRDCDSFDVPPPSEEETTEVLAEMHAAIGGHVLEQWGMPKCLHDPIVWHHDPAGAKDRPAAAMVAYVANRLAHRYGFGCAAEAFDPMADEVIVKFGMDARAIEKLDLHAPGLFEVARKIAG
jgi:HD-like signal output (HDOD) protein